MLFLSPWMLLGLAGVAIPVIIHLARRQAAKPLDWGAMRFLQDTVAARKRRVEWEDLLLMAARCLLVALVALAVARPFLPPDSTVPWLFVIPVTLLGVALLGGSFVLWNPRLRWLLRGVSVLLLLAAAALILLEKRLNLKRFEATGRQDVALVIDASSSMALTRDGTSNFERALAEAREVVREAPRGTAFTVVLGGPAPEARTAAPLTHREDVLGVLDELQAVGGPFRAHEALGMATLALAEGTNASKEIIVFTDEQRHGWRLDNPGAWDGLAEAWDAMPAKPKLLVRNFGRPPVFRNVGLSTLEFSRPLVGTDRAVTLRVTVSNTGDEALAPGPVALEIDGKEVGQKPVGLLRTGQSETVTFRHRFAAPGPAVVRARLTSDDDLASDNQLERVVAVRKSLPVLLVDGNPSAGFFERATGFLALALAPDAISRLANPSASSRPTRHFMDPEVIPVTNISLEALKNREVIVLADVPRLPASLADHLAREVAAGCGLVVLAGPRCDPAFYNSWVGGPGPVLPLTLGEEATAADGLAPASATFDHESLSLFREGSDLDTALIHRWRRTGEAAPGGAPGAALANGDPWLASRPFGRGRSLLVTSALDARAGNLPAKRSFVPLAHELITWAAGSGLELNVESSWNPRVVLDGMRSGLTGTYTRARESTPAHTRIDPAIDFDWGGGQPAKDVSRDRFEVRWSGWLDPPRTGRYRFHANVDDTFALKIGDRPWMRCNLGRHDLGEVELTAGKREPIVATYTEEHGEAFVQLSWTPPDGSREIVPSHAFSPGGTEEREALSAIDPRGGVRTATVVTSDRESALAIGGSAVPGIFEVETGALGKSWLPGWDGGTLPVAVVADPQESSFAGMDDDDLALIRSRIDLLRPTSPGDILAVLEGKGFGRGIWRWLALAAFAFFLLESVLARWVSRSRRTAESIAVEFDGNSMWTGGPR